MSTTMLYKEGGDHIVWNDIPCNYIVVADSEIDAHIADGWKLSPFDLYKDSENEPEVKRRGRKPKEQ